MSTGGPIGLLVLGLLPALLAVRSERRGRSRAENGGAGRSEADPSPGPRAAEV